jgi:predicted alpha/beta-fold hydrolase
MIWHVGVVIDETLLWLYNHLCCCSLNHNGRRTIMAVWQSGDIEVNGLSLHYTRTGGDKPQVVLAHGFSDDGLCWTPVAELLEADYDVIMVDARGHGRSEGPEAGYGSV